MKRFFVTALQYFAAGTDSGGTDTNGNENVGGELSAPDGKEKNEKHETKSTENADENAVGGGKKPNKAVRSKNAENANGNGENTGEKSPNEDAENTVGAAAETLAQALLNAETDGIISEWKADGEKLCEIYPSFSLGRELAEQPLFGTLLKSGVDVRHAYECVHLNEILGGAVRYAVAETGRRAAESVRNASQRPGENSVLGRASSVARTDVKSLTDRDILRILSEVGRGAKITFK